MADKKQETIAEIVAWLRTPQDGENGYLAAWRAEIADRIEAAHKREMEAVIKRNHLGNGAKLREALEFAEDELWAHGLFDASKRIASALAAPPRNCDKYATADEALKAQEQMFNDSNFANGECKLGCPECDNPRVGCKIAWLFAPATEKEGGAK